MKGKKFLNTRNVVIGLVSCILIGASATGVTIFLKDRGQAAAATEQEPAENLPITGNENNPTEPGENPEVPVEPTEPGEEPTIPGEDEEPETPGETTNRPETTTPGNEEETPRVEETVTEVERTLETYDLNLSWSTIALSAVTTEGMGIYKPNLEIEKTATGVIKAEDSEEIELDPTTTKVVAGDKVVYEITVKNTGNYKATNVAVTETLDVVVDENTETTKVGEKIAEFETIEPRTEGKFKVTYTVTQDDIDNLEVTKLTNTITITDGKTETEDKDDTVEKEQVEAYTIDKVSKIMARKDGTTPEKAEIGDKIKYTITVTNTGTVTLKNLEVKDPMIGLNEKIDLAYQGKKVYEEEYTIEEKDIKTAAENDGKLYNQAVGTYKGKPTETPEIPTDVKTKYSYIVEHYQEQLDGTYTKVATDPAVEAEYGTPVSYTSKTDYAGFTFDQARAEREYGNATVPANDDLVVKIYYTANTDVSYIVKYVDATTGEELLHSVPRTGKTFDVTYTETAEEITGYKPDETSKTITLDAYNKELVFKYTRLCTVTYYVNGVKVGEDKDIVAGTTNYVIKSDDEDNGNLTITPPGNFEVFSGFWNDKLDESGNEYAIYSTTTISFDLNLYAQFVGVKIVSDEADGFWQKRLTGDWRDARSQFRPILINSNFHKQVFYCTNGSSNDLNFTTTGTISHVYEILESGEEIEITDNKGNFTMYRGHTYKFNVKGDSEPIIVKVK